MVASNKTVSPFIKVASMSTPIMISEDREPRNLELLVRVAIFKDFCHLWVVDCIQAIHVDVVTGIDESLRLQSFSALQHLSGNVELSIRIALPLRGAGLTFWILRAVDPSMALPVHSEVRITVAPVANSKDVALAIGSCFWVHKSWPWIDVGVIRACSLIASATCTRAVFLGNYASRCVTVFVLLSYQPPDSVSTSLVALRTMCAT
mmetsp:Transcript_105005/g.191796  ORF Transcript_105005/g.191796 Transcript_105005/m.191796 type:complete len:206 (+) Transcript_105005:679-1296(+)